MKAEQACRFRLDEGYCVFAQSPGVTPSQENALGDIFNSTMNSIFPAIGDSILSCATGPEDAFLARNTLRTDIHGRKTVFTHTYILPLAEYARLMQEDPTQILGVEITALLDNESPGAQVSAQELTPTAQFAPIEALFAKYNLDKLRYGRLLLGAYLAITSNSSLQLVTNLSLEQSPAMVRELTLCILEGLLPILKGKVTFSTGADPRMNISVISTVNTSNPSGELLFGVEDDRYTNIRPRDELTELAFYSLAELSHEARAESAKKMQAWLSETTNIQEGLSLTLICTAFCMTSGMALGTDALLMLFRSIGNARGIPTDVANNLLTYLVQRMHQGEGCSTAALSIMAGRYLREDSSDAFRAAADQAFSVAPVEVCIALAEAIFKQEMTDRVRQMLRTLMRRIPTDDPGLNVELRVKLILWVLAENETEFIDYATVLMLGCPGSEYAKLALGVLESTREKVLTQAQDAILTKAVGYMAENKMSMPDPHIAILDSHSVHASEALTRSSLQYLFKVRLAKVDAEAGLALVDGIVEAYPAYGAAILEQLAAGANQAVWELYQTRRYLVEEISANEIFAVLQEHNRFNNPGGPFETRAAACWKPRMLDEFKAIPAEAGSALAYSQVADRCFQGTDMLNLSQDVKTELATTVARYFWDTVTMEQLYDNRDAIPQRLYENPELSTIKMVISFACQKLHLNCKSCTTLLDEIRAPETDPEMRAALITCAREMIPRVLLAHKFLSWDLVLCSCWKVTEKENGPDLKQFIERCVQLDQFFEEHKATPVIDVDASALLADEKLRKSVYKLNSNSPTFQALVEVIKPERTGFFSFLSGGKKDAPEKKEHPGKAKREKPGFFDPTVPFQPEDDEDRKG